MIKYIKCPRCELNYIDSEKQEYCDVCIAEMKGNKLQFADLEDEELEETAEKSEICPICGVNPINYGEKMCEKCRQESQYEEEQDVNMDTDEEWKNYIDDDEDIDMGEADLDDQLSEELDEEFDEESEEDLYEDDDPLSDFDEDLDEDLDDYDEDDEDEDEDDDDNDDLF